MRILSKCTGRYKEYRCKTKFKRYIRWIKKQTLKLDSGVISAVCCFVLLVVFILVILWLYIRDPCDSYKIKDKICNEYEEGIAAGQWCYELCVENSISFSKCLSKTQHSTSFLWQEKIAKIQYVPDPFKAASSNHLPLHLTDLQESLSLESFTHLLTKFIHSKLGPDSDQNPFLTRILSFADFNKDGEIKFGEASSVWELLHVHEFFILFLFQGESVFPRINGTCGNIYFYEQTGNVQLFDKYEKGVFSKFFSNTYRWSFPDWHKRANIVMGLLEFVGTLVEISNSNFYMCDISATKFGFEKFEAKVVSVEQIMSQKMLEDNLIGRNCYTDQDCAYGKSCMTSCDSQTGKCDSIILKPNLVNVCEIIQDFLLFDTPIELKPEMVHILSQCVSLSNNSTRIAPRILNESFLQHNLILSKLKSFIWDQIKEKPSNWLKPRYPIPKLP